MAEENPKPSSSSNSSGEGKNLLHGAIGFMVFVALFVGWLNTASFLNDDNGVDENTGILSVSRLLPSGSLAIGQKVVNKQLNNIRQQVGGAIIGNQDKREIGTILEGPVNKFGSIWWRVDYPNAPDGWTEEKGITSKVATFRAFNIFPILYDNFLKPVGIIFSIIGGFIFVVIYFLHSEANAQEEKLQAIRKKKALAYFRPELEKAEHVVDDTGDVPFNLPTSEDVPEVQQHSSSVAKNERWEHVKKLMESHSDNDWRQAILEADIILDSMVERMGYDGDTLFERLKKIEQSDFVTLENAFEGHRARNKIAHSGSEFHLSRNEADRIIGLYEKVFREFYYI